MITLIIGVFAGLVVIGALVWFALGTTAARSKAAFTMIRSSDAKQRQRAVTLLARLALSKAPNAFEALDRATEDADPLVRRAASQSVDALGRKLGRLPLTPVPDQDKLDAYKKRLLSDETEGRRAGMEIRNLGDPWIYQAGIQLRSDSRGASTDIRARAIRGLGYLGDPISGSFLLLTLGEPEPALRAAAAFAAGEVKARRCLKALEFLATGDPDASVRTSAQRAVKQLKHAGE